MRTRTKRSKYIIATGVVATSLMLVACSDAPTQVAPPASHISMPKPSRIAFAVVSHQVDGDTAISLITLDTEQEDSFLLPDGAKITFPAQSVCDIATTSYGTDHWNEPCEPQRTSVQITVRSWVDSTGHPRLDFSPRMRFNPAANPVVLSLVTSDPAGTSLGINYCPDDAETCIDESIADSDLLTFFDSASGTYFRRVKHFSGYNIASGRSLDVSADAL